MMGSNQNGVSDAGEVQSLADTGFDAMSLRHLAQQASGTQRGDLSQDAGANTPEIDSSDVLAEDRDVLVITVCSNDVVGERTYVLWANAGAHLLIDDRAWVQATVL
jgi:hypothetical protein